MKMNAVGHLKDSTRGQREPHSEVQDSTHLGTAAGPGSPCEKSCYLQSRVTVAGKPQRELRPENKSHCFRGEEGRRKETEAVAAEFKPALGTVRRGGDQPTQTSQGLVGRKVTRR